MENIVPFVAQPKRPSLKISGLVVQVATNICEKSPLPQPTKCRTAHSTQAKHQGDKLEILHQFYNAANADTYAGNDVAEEGNGVSGEHLMVARHILSYI
jgi:hypothetical protein